MDNRLTIKQHRLLLDMSQKEFANWIGINYYTYRYKEMGKNDWKVREIKLIANKLNVKISDLIIT